LLDRLPCTVSRSQARLNIVAGISSGPPVRSRERAVSTQIASGVRRVTTFCFGAGPSVRKTGSRRTSAVSAP